MSPTSIASMMAALVHLISPQNWPGREETYAAIDPSETVSSPDLPVRYR